MNKNDFYKELMQNYTFDAEEIRKNAMKQKFAKNRLNTIKLASLVGSVAVCTVLVGTLLFTQLGQNGDGGVVIEPSALVDMTPEDRIKLAMENIEKYSDSDAFENLMITFIRNFSVGEVNDIFAQYSTDESPIKIKTLYFEDGSKASGDEVSSVFKNGDSRLVKGAAINCSLLLFKDLNANTNICLIELMAEEDEQAVPIDVDTIISETTDSQAEQTDNPSVTTTINQDNTPASTDISESPDIPTENTEDDIDLNDPNLPSVSSESNETTSENPVVTLSPITDIPVTDNQGNVSVPSGEATEETPAVTTAIPVITLPTDIEKTTINVSVSGATNAYFVNENTFLITTDTTFELYSMKNGAFSNVLTVYGDSPKIHWLSTDGKYAIISLLDSYGTRTNVQFIDTVSFSSTSIDLTDVLLGSSSIKSVAYNAESEALVFTFDENETNYIGVVGIRSDGSKNNSVQAYESKNSISLLAMNGSTIYFAETTKKGASIHKLDTISFDDTVIKTYGVIPKFSKNTAFNCGIIIPNENDVIGFTEIFDAKTEKFIQTDYFIANLTFSLDGRYFITGDSAYKVSNGTIESVPLTIDIMKAVDYKNSLSSTYTVAVVGDDTITIKQSSYSSENMSNNLVFSTPNESNDTEIRKVFDNAIGVNNLFSEYKTTIGEYHPIEGINSTASAKALIAEYYSSEITELIFRRCEFTASENKLFSKNATGLKSISISDCVLVLDSSNDTTAKYILYTKQGSFNGKAGYKTTSITFVKENGKWKLATALV